jgi:hypothetical protein
VKQPIEADFDVQNHDAGVGVTFRPTESKYSFVLLADRRSVSLRELVFDMARLAILAIMPPVMSKPQHFV